MVAPAFSKAASGDTRTVCTKSQHFCNVAMSRGLGTWHFCNSSCRGLGPPRASEARWLPGDLGRFHVQPRG